MSLAGLGWFGSFFRGLTIVQNLLQSVGKFLRENIAGFMSLLVGSSLAFFPKFIAFAVSFPQRIESSLLAFMDEVPQLDLPAVDGVAPFVLAFFPLGVLITASGLFLTLWSALFVYRFVKSWIPTVN